MLVQVYSHVNIDSTLNIMMRQIEPQPSPNKLFPTGRVSRKYVLLMFYIITVHMYNGNVQKRNVPFIRAFPLLHSFKRIYREADLTRFSFFCSPSFFFFFFFTLYFGHDCTGVYYFSFFVFFLIFLFFFLTTSSSVYLASRPSSVSFVVF